MIEIALVSIIVVLGILLVKNSINNNIRNKWIEDIYNDRTLSFEFGYKWSDLPDYYKTLFDPTLWKYQPLKEYLNR